MELQISPRMTEDGVVILDVVAAQFTYPQTALLKNQVSQLIQQGYRVFLVNCSGIEMVDSTGLASIVSTYKLATEVGGGLILFGANPLFEKLMKLTHLHHVLDVWSSEAQALYDAKERFGKILVS